MRRWVADHVHGLVVWVRVECHGYPWLLDAGWHRGRLFEAFWTPGDYERLGDLGGIVERGIGVFGYCRRDGCDGSFGYLPVLDR